jgi:DNA invertase Pin-like site-specific DNA recombinase
MVFVRKMALRDSGNGVNESAGNAGFCKHCGGAAGSENPLYRKDRFCTAMTNPRRIGYIRVSTKTQAPDRQIEALRAECDELNIEYVSAVADARPVFDNVITNLQPGDSFVVMDLDRAFRSSIDAILTAEHLRQINVTFRILSMAIDTSTPEGELYYTIVAGYAQFERRIISRRTKEGLAAARARGVKLGRRPKLTDEEVRAAHKRLSRQSSEQIAQSIGVSRPTLQRCFRRLGLSYIK